MDYDFRAHKWQKTWKETDAYKVTEDPNRPKFYVLDMFPYPSGAGLHVGHPLGYIASDVFARYKRHKGFNVLHPMGYDSFGLPAEQYAIQTGQHPAVTTEQNINRYREQLEQLGFCYDWSREVRTSDPSYYRWTQWIFGELFESWFDVEAQKARPIETLIAAFAENGNFNVNAACEEDWWTQLSFPHFGAHFDGTFTATDWQSMSEAQRAEVLMCFRIAYLADSEVNWCPALGTVLANDEVKDGLSERGGHPVVKKTMRQWMMRITAYADRLLNSLNHLEWPDSVKEHSVISWAFRRSDRPFRIGQRQGQPDDAGAEVEVFTTRQTPFVGRFHGACSRTQTRRSTHVRIPTHQVQAYIEAAGMNERTARRQNDLWRVHRRPRGASRHGRVGSGLDCRLRACRLRHRRHHGRASW